jgi:hypothetical protein
MQFKRLTDSWIWNSHAICYPIDTVRAPRGSSFSLFIADYHKEVASAFSRLQRNNG